MENQQIQLNKLNLDQLKSLWFDTFQLKQRVDNDIQVLNKVINERIAFENAAKTERPESKKIEEKVPVLEES